MSSPILQVENLSKYYQIRHDVVDPYSTLSGALADAGRNLFHYLLHPAGKSRKVTRETFKALDDVSFEVNRGDRIGIVGCNGAGKSTLLKLLSRITEPSRGSIRIRGRLSSLLEVGTGFHSELSGRENIFLNGSILGMKQAEIRRKFDAIVDFAGVEKFLDTPVKRYSSGMYVRLAFAVAAHLEPDILLIDEVLAVGDMEFQKKCLGKMNDISKDEGRTILFVSHNMEALTSLCDRAILLESGKLTMDADCEQVVLQYAKSIASTKAAPLSEFRARQSRSTGEVLFQDMQIETETGSPIPKTGERVRFRFFFKHRDPSKPFSNMIFSMTVGNLFHPLFNLYYSMGPDGGAAVLQDGDCLECSIPRLPLTEGDYYINLFIGQPHSQADCLENIPFPVLGARFQSGQRNCGDMHKGNVTLIPHEFTLRGKHD